MSQMSNLKLIGTVIGGCNFIGFCITASVETHKITDLVGVGSFVAASSMLISGNKDFVLRDSRALIMNLAVMFWGVRLATFLFYRVLCVGEDKRLRKFFRQPGETFFDSSKSLFPVKLGSFWAIQSMWGFICMMPVVLATSAQPSSEPLGFGSLLMAGLVVLGFLIEALADYQKFTFKNNRQNDGKWCDVGLFAWARHPNYFGELLFWWSMYGLAFPSFEGLCPQLLGLMSPCFITFLLLKLSGVPLLEKSNKAKYCEGEAKRNYELYKSQTNLLLPLPNLFSSSNTKKNS